MPDFMGIAGDTKKLLSAPELEQAKNTLIALINESDNIETVKKCLKLVEG